jgi:hypothetical protein
VSLGRDANHLQQDGEREGIVGEYHYYQQQQQQQQRPQQQSKKGRDTADLTSDL